jgi:hypothetical protein
MSLMSIVASVVEVATDVVEEVVSSVESGADSQAEIDKLRALADDARQRRQAGLDTLQRLLDIMVSMNSPTSGGVGRDGGTSDSEEHASVAAAAVGTLLLLDYLVLCHSIAGDRAGAELAASAARDLTSVLAAGRSGLQSAQHKKVLISRMDMLCNTALALARRRPRIRVKLSPGKHRLSPFPCTSAAALLAVTQYVQRSTARAAQNPRLGVGLGRLSLAVQRGARVGI